MHRSSSMLIMESLQHGKKHYQFSRCSFQSTWLSVLSECVDAGFSRTIADERIRCFLMSNRRKWPVSGWTIVVGSRGHNFVRMLFDKTLKSPPVFSKSVRPTEPANNVSPTNNDLYHLRQLIEDNILQVYGQVCEEFQNPTNRAIAIGHQHFMVCNCRSGRAIPYRTAAFFASVCKKVSSGCKYQSTSK